MKNKATSYRYSEYDQGVGEDLGGHILEEENDAWRKALGARIADAAGRAESLEMAAHAAGISASTLRRYMRGEVSPPFSAMIGLARMSGLSLEWLATGEGQREIPLVRASLLHAAVDRTDGRQESDANTENLKRNQSTDSTGAANAARAQLSLIPENLDRLAGLLAAVQRLPVGMSVQEQLMLSYRIMGLIDYLATQGGREERLDQEDLVALAAVLHKMIGKE